MRRWCPRRRPPRMRAQSRASSRCEPPCFCPYSDQLRRPLVEGSHGPIIISAGAKHPLALAHLDGPIRAVRVVELPFDACNVPSVCPGDRVDEVIEPAPDAIRLERDVTSSREEHAIPEESPEEVVLQFRVLARLRDVDRDPAGIRGIELRPAVVPLHLHLPRPVRLVVAVSKR